MANEPDYDSSETQPNQIQLVELLSGLAPNEPLVELYGCWEDEFSMPCVLRTEIHPSGLLVPQFMFRAHCLYRVALR